MAESLWNDIMYTDVLHSDGYVVDYAVCTTYSMDLPTLLSVPFMLGALSDMPEDAMRSSYMVLEAINRAAGKFAVFCNAGCIAVPQSNAKIYSLLEQSVVQVMLDQSEKGFVNFHPKVWVIKETNQDSGDSQLKLVVMSRNLTRSNDLDIVCELVGKVGHEKASDEAMAKHKPLADFLEWLSEKAGGDIADKINGLIEALANVERFDLEGSPFVDYEFFPMGIPGYKGSEQCLKKSILKGAEGIVTISPFVDLNVLNRIGQCSRKTLITRHSSLSNEIIDLFGGEVYAPMEVLVDNEDKEQTVDLHEKVYFVHRCSDGQNTNHLYLGSTNASTNGFDRNVEFILHLQFAPYKISYDSFCKELLDSKESLFEQVTCVPDKKEEQDGVEDQKRLQMAIRQIECAQVEEDGLKYKVTLRCKKDSPSDVSVYPLGYEGFKAMLSDGLVFSGLSLEMLTEFYVVMAGSLQRLIKVPTKGIPTEERDKAIFRSMIDTPAKFVNYLSLMLSDDPVYYDHEIRKFEQEHQSGQLADQRLQLISLSLYEDMVRMAYKEPSRILSVKKLLEKADESVIPENFKELYKAFEKVLKKIKRL